MGKKLHQSKAPRPPVTLRKMSDGSYRIYGLINRSRIHLKKEMRAWVRHDDGKDGETYYSSWSRAEAETYAAAHDLVISEPTLS